MAGIVNKINPAKAVAVGIPLLILLYFFYLVAFNVAQTYTVDIGADRDIDPGHDAYLRDMTKQGRLSLRMSIEDDTFRNMTGSPVYFYITPENQIFNDTRIAAELRFRGDADLDIGAYRAYAWKPLYMRSLDNYTLAKRFGDAAIYARDNRSIYADYDNMSEWITANIPEYSTVTLYDFSPRMLVNRDLTYKDAETEVNQTFRGTHSFLVYINGSLNLTLGKQDLNWYNGSDEYSVGLYDLDGSLLFNDTIPDDGIIDKSSQRMPAQFKTFFYDGIREGLYELRLVNIKGENSYADSTITDIKINTDKLVTQGNILLLAPGTLYFELKHGAEIKFNAKKAQTAAIRGAVKKDVKIDKSHLNKWVPVELPPGSYTVEINGDIYLSGANFAFSKGSLFQPYNYEINGGSGEWVIISNYQVEKDKKGWITARRMFTGSELELSNNRTMVFGLRKMGENEVTLSEFKVTLTAR